MRWEDIEAFRKDWPSQYECQFVQSDREIGLRELAREYLKVTEDYDQMICAHRKGNIAIPMTHEERTLSTQFAQKKRQEYKEIAERKGLIGEVSFWQAVKAEEREFERTYRFVLTPDTQENKMGK